MGTITIIKKVSVPKNKYDCGKCPGYCCSYDIIPVNKRDLTRLAKHFGVTEAQAEVRYTKIIEGQVGMRHAKDSVYKSMCMLFDQEKRRCSAYEGRPSICREYPSGTKCGYYDFLRFERDLQEDKDFVPSA
jgi:Fe-S-cluster containining protein